MIHNWRPNLVRPCTISYPADCAVSADRIWGAWTNKPTKSNSREPSCRRHGGHYDSRQAQRPGESCVATGDIGRVDDGYCFIYFIADRKQT